MEMVYVSQGRQISFQYLHQSSSRGMYGFKIAGLPSPIRSSSLLTTAFLMNSSDLKPLVTMRIVDGKFWRINAENSRKKAP